MTAAHADSMKRLMQELARLPGIGPRTAERLAYFILRQPPDQALQLADAITAVKSRIRHCSRCFNLAEQDLCDICRDARRDHSVVCVVEQPTDLITLEQTGLCTWVYHVLLGQLAPLDGVTPDDLTIDALVRRVRAGGINELVMATNPTMEGDGTALYISSLLADAGAKITRLARGLPAGGTIEYANKSVLTDAIRHRTPLP